MSNLPYHILLDKTGYYNILTSRYITDHVLIHQYDELSRITVDLPAKDAVCVKYPADWFEVTIWD